MLSFCSFSVWNYRICNSGMTFSALTISLLYFGVLRVWFNDLAFFISPLISCVLSTLQSFSSFQWPHVAVEILYSFSFLVAFYLQFRCFFFSVGFSVLIFSLSSANWSFIHFFLPFCVMIYFSLRSCGFQRSNLYFYSTTN